MRKEIILDHKIFCEMIFGCYYGVVYIIRNKKYIINKISYYKHKIFLKLIWEEYSLNTMEEEIEKRICIKVTRLVISLQKFIKEIEYPSQYINININEVQNPYFIEKFILKNMI